MTLEGEEPRREAGRHVPGTTPAPCAAASTFSLVPAAYGRLFAAGGRLSHSFVRLTSAVCTHAHSVACGGKAVV